MSYIEFHKPLDLVNLEGKKLSTVAIDELEHKWGELPTFNGHFLDLGFIERNPKRCRPTDKIKKVIFNAPATIVIWADGTKTVVKCQHNDEYNAEIGLLMCIAKKHFGNTGNFNEVFKKWIDDYKAPDPKRYLWCDTLNRCFGIPGEPTPYKDSEGNALFVGDVVRVMSHYRVINNDTFICNNGEKTFVMGIECMCCDKTGEIEEYTVTRVKKYTDVKVGEKHTLVTLREE